MLLVVSAYLYISLLAQLDVLCSTAAGADVDALF